MSKLDYWIDNKIVQNLFIWFLLFLILTTSINAENRFLASLFAIGILAPASYINNLLILPLLRRKTFVFGLLFIANTFAFSVITVFILQHNANEPFLWGMLYNFMGIMFLAMVFSSAIKIARDSFTRRQQEKESELKLLKAQLNPHFLFNTLNNLYGLSVIKSDKLPDLMLKLSNLLRYSLYETKEVKVPLQKEITYLENYISLEKIRLDDQTNIQFVKSGDLSAKNIAPMLLIVFVENAFKHLEVVNDKMSQVTVSIEVKNETLHFKCLNSMDELSTSNDNIETGKSGIGLQNARKRLNLLYPNKYKLKTLKENGNYSVDLILDIK